MKEFNFSLINSDSVFKSRAIRSRNDCIISLMEICKWVLISNCQSYIDVNNCLTIEVDSMSRVFINRNAAMFSIVFPFNILKIDDAIEISIKGTDILLNSANTSMVISLLNSDSTANEACDGELGSALEEAVDIVRHLEQYEDGYLRFDHDADRADNIYHPLYHFDFYYSQSATIKVGFDTPPSIASFRDLINGLTPAYYARR